MPAFFGSTIARKLTWMNMAVSGAALALACAGFFTYDQISFREILVRNLSAQARIIGFNSISAITFNDRQSAEKTLSALSRSPNIISAGITTPNGAMFAEYSRTHADQILKAPLVAPDQPEADEFTENELILVRKIVFDGKEIGRVFIRSDLQELNDRIQRYIGIVIAVLLASLVVALLFSGFFQRSVAVPIVQLAETARQVSRDKNYSIGAQPTKDRSEVSDLIAAFNDMLTQIRLRDEALQRAQGELEQRVEERTRQLVAANKELEAFSYSVSHDLRGPLEVINGFTYMLLADYGDKLDALGRDHLKRMHAGARRMAELIEDLLNLSRVTSTAILRERVDLTALAKSIVKDLQQKEPSRRVEFHIADSAIAHGDPRLLQVVMENLLRNSWKYTSRHDHARIDFDWEQRNGNSVYFVRDDGAGFDPNHSDRLFQPFQRLHSKAEFDGTGIGLATVSRVIQRHGGRVWAEGAVEKGATFYFTIP